MDDYTGPDRRTAPTEAPYRGQERRASDDALMLLIHEKIDRIETALQKHVTDESLKLAERSKY